MSEAVCANPECTRAIGKKYVLCRPCAIAHTRERHPYVEPCGSYRAEPLAHLVHFTCAECGFGSDLHPGGGRVSLVKVVIP